MMKKAKSYFALLLVAAVFWLPGGASAEDSRGRYVPDEQVRNAFDDVVRDARKSVVEVIVGEDETVLGTVVDRQGYILTKASELATDERLLVRLPNGRRVAAKLVDVDRFNDLAMLKVEARGLRPVRFSEKELGLGRWVACVSTDVSPSAVGIVSAKPRKIQAPRLVLGVALRDHPSGLRVESLIAGFGAQVAGIRRGDVLTRVVDTRVNTLQHLIERLQGYAAGDEVGVELLRGGVAMKFKVRLSELAPDPRSRAERMNRMGGEISERRRGFEEVIQHDAEIRPEHCGGPLVNLRGEVVGINIARAGRIATYALPASLIKEKVDKLKRGELGPAASRPAADEDGPRVSETPSS